MIVSSLINNITLIVSLSILYSLIIRRWDYESRANRVISGFLFGAVAVVGMMNPLVFSPGLIFDGRSIIVSAAGFFGGWVAALISALMSIAYRVWLGGPGAVMGVSVITCSALIGIGYHHIRLRHPHVTKPLHLLGFGLVVHFCMLVLTMTLPSTMRFDVLAKIAMSVMTIYPLGTLLVCLVLLDQESRARAEMSLRESEEKHRLVVENAHEAIIITQAGKLVFLNRMAMEMTGYSWEELTSMPFTAFIHPADSRMVLDNHMKRMSGDYVPPIYSFRIVNKDGTVKWVESKSTLINWNGQTSALTFLSDITDRKQTEEALMHSEQRFRAIFNSTFQFTGLLTPDGTLIEVNQAALDFAGVTMSDVRDRPFWEARWWAGDEDRVRQVKDAIKRAAAGEFVRYEVKLQGAGEATAVIDFSLKPVYGASGEIAMLIHEGRDITEIRRAEEERKEIAERLQRAEKMEVLGRLSGGVAHDLNNVLGILVGYSELLQEKLPEDSPLRRYADNIHQSGVRGAAIIQDLLTLARRGVTVSEVVDLNRLIENYFKTLEFEKLKADHPGVKMVTDLAGVLLNIKGSPVHLGKTLMNLVSNAFESIAGLGEVTVTTENRYLDHPLLGYDEMQEGDYVVLTVSDTGSGISEKDLGRIFEPFYTKKAMGRSGTGLGLAIVWGVVKDHNGYIDVRSREGEGTVFSLYFPVTREEPAEGEKALSVEKYSGRGESVLVVDDVEGQRKLAVAMLERLGYRVEAVSSGEEAVAYLRTKQADLVVLDMIMTPGMDGLDTYAKILAEHHRQKAVIVSGFAETGRVRKMQEMGAGQFVKKPYLMGKLGMAVRRELDRG